MDVRYYDRRVQEFVESLKDPVLGKVLGAITLLIDYGHNVGMPQSKKIATDLFELRTQGSPSIRLIYTFHEGGAVILYGFKKKTQKIPLQELRNAESRLRKLVTV